MSDGRRSNTSVWLYALGGVACGALVTALLYFYFQLARPSPYNIILFGYAPVLMTFGGMAGLVFSAMRESD